MDDVAEKLAARALLYRLFCSLLSEPPEAEALEVALSGLVGEALGLCNVEYDGVRLSSMRFAFAKDADAFVRQARDQYQRLFYQPGKLAAPPWESSYVGNERKVFQRCTLAARTAYRNQGLRLRAVNRIPDDHIAIELGFLSEMALRMCDGGESERQRALAASLSFAREHLARWIASYTRDAEGAAKGEFYAWINATLRGFIESDIAFMAEFERSLQPACLAS